ncbi:BglG family transcription antiterminator [Bacillus sp. JJ1521]|uniref:BglG family transcription antiterminator n=1 Tax=Bacillus sp. JJ1521 TaxID=3122957 RepID=UPI002FFEB2E4
MLNISLDQRSTAILSHLVNTESFVPLKELMEKFKISRRTVYYDIEKINGWLKENNLKPVNQVRGLGFGLEQETSKRIPEKIELFISWQYDYSAKERKGWLALYLLGRDSTLFLEDLAEKVRVSRNTTIDDLKVLKEEIERFHLKLEFERKTGYRIIGQEEDKRKAIVYYLSNVLPNEGWKTMLAKITTMLNLAGSNIENRLNLFELEELKAVQRIIAESETDLSVQYTDDFFNSLTFRFLFFGKRLMQGKEISIDEVEKGVLTETKEYKAAFKIAQKLSYVFNVDFPHDEVLYITKHLLSSRVQSSQGEFQDSENTPTHVLAEVVPKMVSDFQKYACVFLKERDLLERNLLLHVKPSYYRIKYGLEVENPVAELMKEKYPDVFLLTKKVIHHLENVIGKKVNENEVALIAMHFGGWMRRTGVTPANRKKMLIVCASGVGTSKLLEHQLEGLFSTIDIVGSVSLREYEINDYEVDFVVSTTPLTKKDKPVFVVSPILSEAEKESLLKNVNALVGTNMIEQSTSIEGLMGIIKKHATIKDEESLEREVRKYFSNHQSKVVLSTKPSLHQLLTREFIQIKKGSTDWKEAIRVGAKPLLEKGNITEEYIQSMINTVIQLGPYIVVAPKVAIPHAKPENGVKKLGMSLLCLEEGVQFSESKRHEVNLLIVLAAIDGETHLKALSQLTTMFSEPMNVKKMVQAKSIDTILQTIEAYSI